MPGLSYQRSPTNIQTRPNSNFLLNTDSYILDSTVADLVLPPKAQPCPLIPSKHKTCKPSCSQASWMMCMKQEECKGLHSYKWTVNSKSCPTQSNIENGSDGDTDLATMVHDFIENGSYSCEHYDSNESDMVPPSPEMLCNNLQAIISGINLFGRDIQSVVEVILSTHNVKDIACRVENTDCKGGCLRQFVVRHLRSLRYNAAICVIKWQNSGTLLGGEYEYIDVISDDRYAHGDRIIIDLDFQSQFEIARPTQHYLAALKLLPTIFIGPCEKLEGILSIMSEAAKYSLKQNCMHLPPWRTLDYMCAKWLTPSERKPCDMSPALFKGHSTPQISILKEKELSWGSSESSQCWELVKHIKASCLKDDTERKAPNSKLYSSRVGKSYMIRKKSNAW